MSRNARQCDRCGKLYKEYGVERHDNNAIMLISMKMDGTYLEDIPKDLCPECLEEFKTFMEGEEIKKPSPAENFATGVKEIVTTYNRQDIYNLVKKIAVLEGGFNNIITVQKEIYKELEKRFGINLKECLIRQKKMLESNGRSTEKYTMLDLIYSEACTRDEYIKIVLEKARKHGICV